MALWQAEHVARLLRQLHPEREIKLVPLSTEGDRKLQTPLARFGGKGLFIKALEAALEDGRAELAVHSMKDVPVVLPKGMAIVAVLERGDPRDVLICRDCASFNALPEGARIGSSSLRRQAQLRHARRDLEVVNVRGNVDTRLAKLDCGECDALILAAAGFARLDLTERIAAVLDPDFCLPAIAQGTIGIECRADDIATRALIAPLNHAATWTRTLAERALNRALGGSCETPIAGFAELGGTELALRARLGLPDGSRLIGAELTGPAAGAEALGSAAAERLRTQGADEILAQLDGGYGAQLK
jgi:hydroxymethylbilane synthase